MNEEAMLKIDAAIDEIENYVSGAHRVPLLEKVLVKDDELFHLMDNLRNPGGKRGSGSVPSQG